MTYLCAIFAVENIGETIMEEVAKEKKSRKLGLLFGC